MRPRSSMGPVQKQDPRPNVDGSVELSLDVVVEAKLQQLFDLGSTILAAHRRGGSVVTLSWVRHGEKSPTAGEPWPIMGHRTGIVNRAVRCP